MKTLEIKTTVNEVISKEVIKTVNLPYYTKSSEGVLYKIVGDGICDTLMIRWSDHQNGYVIIDWYDNLKRAIVCDECPADEFSIAYNKVMEYLKNKFINK